MKYDSFYDTEEFWNPFTKQIYDSFKAHPDITSVRGQRLTGRDLIIFTIKDELLKQRSNVEQYYHLVCYNANPDEQCTLSKIVGGMGVGIDEPINSWTIDLDIDFFTKKMNANILVNEIIETIKQLSKITK